MLKPIAGLCIASIVLAHSMASSAADGDLDPGFGEGGVAYFSLDGVEGHEMNTRALIALPDGKLLVGGSRNFLVEGSPDPRMRPTLVSLNADGSPDARFGNSPSNPGLLVLPAVTDTGIQNVEAMVRQEDGSILVAGSAFAFGPVAGFVMKLAPDGALDEGFAEGGIASFPDTPLHSIGVDHAGRIIAAGEHIEWAPYQYSGTVLRLTPQGILDAEFGDAGTFRFDNATNDDHSYVETLSIDKDGRIVVGGLYMGMGVGFFSVARLSASGVLDANFASAGWRKFRMPDDDSPYSGIARLLHTPDGKIVAAGYREDVDTGTGIVLIGLGPDGESDGDFGSESTPGYEVIEGIAPGALGRIPSDMIRHEDGRLTISVNYSYPFGRIHDPRFGDQRPNFLAFRVMPDGAPDESFGDHGFVNFDLAPEGAYSLAGALALTGAGQLVIAGIAKRDPQSTLVDLAVVKLGGEGGDDRIFADGFDLPRPPEPLLSTYDDVDESFYGSAFTYNGVRYYHVNGVSGGFPDGSTFTPEDIGDNLIIERGPGFYADYPEWGSSPQALTFGNAYMPGNSISIGALARVTMDLDAMMTSVSFDAAFYENGPWGGILIRLDAYRDGVIVGSDSYVLQGINPTRDNIATRRFSIEGAEFDQLRLHATWDGEPSAPRVMIDNLVLMPAD